MLISRCTKTSLFPLKQYCNWVARHISFQPPSFHYQAIHDYANIRSCSWLPPPWNLFSAYMNLIVGHSLSTVLARLSLKMELHSNATKFIFEHNTIGVVDLIFEHSRIDVDLIQFFIYIQVLCFTVEEKQK